MKHLAGYPVNKSTYDRHRCRCDGCRAANAEAQRLRRQQFGTPTAARIHDRATTKAATWVRKHHPDVWQQLVDEQYARLGAVRRPVGRPAREAS